MSEWGARRVLRLDPASSRMKHNRRGTRRLLYLNGSETILSSSKGVSGFFPSHPVIRPSAGAERLPMRMVGLRNIIVAITIGLVVGGCSENKARCAKECEVKQCGMNSCGEECGICGFGYDCSIDGLCIPCVRSCVEKQCGDDGCGGACGECEAGEYCDPNWKCACLPQCNDRECGDDGCGGTCGVCTEAGEVCLEVAGVCAECTPDCGNRQCGVDDVCQMSCGQCKSNEVCIESGQCECLPNCSGKLCGDDECMGSCGQCGINESCTEIADGGSVCDCLDPFEWFDNIEVPVDPRAGILPGPVFNRVCMRRMPSEYFTNMLCFWDDTPIGVPPSDGTFFRYYWEESTGLLKIYYLFPYGFPLREDGVGVFLDSETVIRLDFSLVESHFLEFDNRTGMFVSEFRQYPEEQCIDK